MRAARAQNLSGCRLYSNTCSMLVWGLRVMRRCRCLGAFVRKENQDAAGRLAAIAGLVARRCADDERAHWACDEWDAAAAEVSAIMAGHPRAGVGRDDHAMSLRHRLPQVAALFTAGNAELPSVRSDRGSHVLDREMAGRWRSLIAHRRRCRVVGTAVDDGNCNAPLIFGSTAMTRARCVGSQSRGAGSRHGRRRPQCARRGR